MSKHPGRLRFWHEEGTSRPLRPRLCQPAGLRANQRPSTPTDLNETDLGDKVGESSYQSVLGLVAWGDAGTQAAAKDGNIKTLKHADQKIFSVLWGLYFKQTTVVYGN